MNRSVTVKGNVRVEFRAVVNGPTASDLNRTVARLLQDFLGSQGSEVDWNSLEVTVTEG